jgi:hypothetical protein
MHYPAKRAPILGAPVPVEVAVTIVTYNSHSWLSK